MAGQGGPKTIAEALEPLTGDDETKAKLFLEQLNEPGHAVREHPGLRTCEICGTRMLPQDHVGEDHDPVWVVEPE